jgi:hypothetical protein
LASRFSIVNSPLTAAEFTGGSQPVSPLGDAAMFNFFFRPYVPGFRVRPQDDVARFNLDRNASGVEEQETNWFDGMRPGLAASQDPDPTQTLASPPGVEDPAQPASSQLPEWFYKLVTMPLPWLSTAVDPRAGRRIVPYAPLINPGRAYQATNQDGLVTGDTRASADGTSAPPDLSSVDAPSAEQWPSSDTEDQPRNSGAAATQEINPQPAAQQAILNTWLPRLADGQPYAEAGSVKPQDPWGAGKARLPTGLLPTLSVRPDADFNFIPVKSGDDAMQQQLLETQRKNQATPPSIAGRPPILRPKTQEFPSLLKATADG